MGKGAKMYKSAITKHLKSKHNLNDAEIEKLLLEYDVDGLEKNFPNYFYYESPEYWAEFLIARM